jgi:integrase
MSWEDFRERYRNLILKGQRPDTIEAAEVRLDVATRILRPKRLCDMADADARHDLQVKLLEGAESWIGPKDENRPRGPRSPHTVKSYMTAVLTALNWAANEMHWLPTVPKVRKVKVSKRRKMKGRAICLEEFEKMLSKVKEVVGEDAEASWKYLLRGLWESGLRLDELMHLHWTDEQYIVPKWRKGALPELQIPASMQKNDTAESIPLLPWLEALFQETPAPQRFGWVFNPMSLQTKLKRRVRHQRPSAEWVGKVISRIGAKAGVIVCPAKGEKKAKYASAHDLRRSCGERMADAEVPERELAKILRHADVQTTRQFYAPGTVQQSAGIIQRKLATVPRNTANSEST